MNGSGNFRAAVERIPARELAGRGSAPAYDRRTAVDPDIVHFGPGAFHRAHQAWFVEKLLAHDRRWGISAVSLRSSDVRDALTPQQNLYTLVLRGETIAYQVIGAIREILVAPESPQAVLQRLAAPTTHVVTATVTEKGYSARRRWRPRRLSRRGLQAQARGRPRAVRHHQLRQPAGQRLKARARDDRCRARDRSRSGALDRRPGPLPQHDGRQHHAGHDG